MTPFAHWTAMTDTREQPSVLRGIPLAEMPTTELSWWEPKPEVPTATRYERGPRLPRLRKFLTGVAVVFGLLALSAVPSPQLDAPVVRVLP